VALNFQKASTSSPGKKSRKAQRQANCPTLMIDGSNDISSNEML